MKKAFRKMDFKDSGYLSEEIYEIKKLITDHNKKLFKLGDAANKIAHTIRFRIEVYPENLQQVLCSCLLIRIMDSYQSIDILCSIGQTVDAGVLLRTLLESVYALKFISEEYESAKEYLKTNLLKRRTLLNIISSDKKGIFESIKRPDLPKLKEEIDKIIDAENIKKLSVEKMAKSVGLEESYQLVYRALSDEVHILPRTLEKYLVMDDDGNIIGLDGTPKSNQVEGILTMATLYLLVAVDVIKDFFEIDDKGMVEKIYNETVGFSKRKGE
jgi:hypothetical protein